MSTTKNNDMARCDVGAMVCEDCDHLVEEWTDHAPVACPKCAGGNLHRVCPCVPVAPTGEGGARVEEVEVLRA